MSKQLKSPLGTRTFESSSPRTYTVPDDTVNNPIFQKESGKIFSDNEREKFQEIRATAIAEKNKISPSSRNRVEFLMGLGKLTEVVEYGGQKFILESLSGRQLTEINEEAIKYSKNNTGDVAQNTHLRSLILAYSVKEINEQDIQLITGFERESEELYDFFKNLDDNLAVVLLAGYSKLKNKCDDMQKLDINKLLEEIKK